MTHPLPVNIIIDFEDAFNSYSGVPISIVSDTRCLILAGFNVVLWYSNKSKTREINLWIERTFSFEQRLRIKLNSTRPSNPKMWVHQVLPWLSRSKIDCDISISHLFPRLPLKGYHQRILRIYDPFGSHRNTLITFFTALYNGARLKHALAWAIRTYSYSSLNKEQSVKVYISKTTKQLCKDIYRDKQSLDFVIYPTVQFAFEDSPYDFQQNKTSIPNRPYFIFIGGQRQRKRPLPIVKLWAEALNQYDFDLVIVGRIEEQLFSDGMKVARNLSRLRLLAGLSVYELRKNIELSSGVVFNSFGEGFGYPIAEAMFLKKPVICNDLPVFREIGEGYPLFYDLGDYKAALEILAGIISRRIDLPKQAPTWLGLEESVKLWQIAITSSVDINKRFR